MLRLPAQHVGYPQRDLPSTTFEVCSVLLVCWAVGGGLSWPGPCDGAVVHALGMLWGSSKPWLCPHLQPARSSLPVTLCQQ